MALKRAQTECGPTAGNGRRGASTASEGPALSHRAQAGWLRRGSVALPQRQGKRSDATSRPEGMHWPIRGRNLVRVHHGALDRLRTVVETVSPPAATAVPPGPSAALLPLGEGQGPAERLPQRGPEASLRHYPVFTASKLVRRTARPAATAAECVGKCQCTKWPKSVYRPKVESGKDSVP